MKVDYFYGSIVIKKDNAGYEQSLGFATARDSQELEFNYPYGVVTPDEAAAVSTFVKTISVAYAKLNKQIDNTNRDLELEEYAPIETSAEAKCIEAKLSAQQELESAVPQSSDSPVGTTDSESIEVVDAGDRLEEVE